jgi:hypothetical protein
MISSECINLEYLEKYFDLTFKKIGNMYNDVIVIQDVINLKFKLIEKEKNKHKYLYYIHNIPVLSEDITITSNFIEITKICIENKGENNIEIIPLKEQDKSFKGELQSIINNGDYSLIELLNDDELINLKVKKYIIKKEISKSKGVTFICHFRKDDFDRDIFLNISYKIPFRENDVWYFQYFIHLKPFSKYSDYQFNVYETDQELDESKIEPQVYFKSIKLGLMKIIFNELNLIPKFYNISEIVVREQQQKEELEYSAPPTQLSTFDSFKVETIKGDIDLSSKEDITYNLSKKKSLKCRIYNLIIFDLTNNFTEIVQYPYTDIVFINNYFNQSINHTEISSISTLNKGKLTIYESNDVNPEFLSTNKILDPKLKYISLGISKTILLKYQLLKKEDSFNENKNKIYLLTIINYAFSKPILTINFQNIDEIYFLYNKFFSNTKEFEKYKGEYKEFQKFKVPIDIIENPITDETISFKSSKNNFNLYLDFILQPKSTHFFIINVKVK